MRRLWLTPWRDAGDRRRRGRAQAQNYPNKTVRIVVPYGPGGGVSLLAQQVGQKMQELMKQPVVIDNRPGAGGNLGADLVAKSPPDGYTLLMHSSAMASVSSLYAKLPFDPVKDFVPVTMVISTQFVIGGSPKNPATNLKELVALAKEKPGAYNYGSSGPGSSLHLFAEMFSNIAGIKLVHIPYRGDAPMITALICKRHPARLPAAGQRHRQRAEQSHPRAWRHRHQADGGDPRRADRAGARLQGPRGRKLGLAVRARRHAARRREDHPGVRREGAGRSAGAAVACFDLARIRSATRPPSSTPSTRRISTATPR